LVELVELVLQDWRIHFFLIRMPSMLLI